MKRIQDLCQGKSIAIVGNAESLHSMHKAVEIDAHDIVIRMNKGVMADPEVLSRHLGFKCSIYAFSGAGYVNEQEHHTQAPDLSVWMTTRKREKAPAHVAFFPEDMWNSLQKDLAELGNSEAEKEIRPSTGLMVIYMILKGVGYRNVDIYGFDFWQTKTFYNRKTISPRRSIQPSAEKLLIDKLLAEHGNVTFVRKPEMDGAHADWLAKGVRILPRPLLSLYARLFSGKFERTYALPPEIFAGKRVLVVGPARTVNADLTGMGDLDYDCIVKMNNGLSTSIEALGPAAWSCDVLFHNLADDSRAVEVEHLRHAGVKTIVHRTASRRFYPKTAQAAEEYGALNPPISVHLIPSWRYKKIRDQLGGYMPSTGLMCIHFLLNSPIASLTIVGFTFFETHYVPGYNDTVTSDADSVQRIRKLGDHNPRQEAVLLQTWLKQAEERGQKVRLGASVQTAMREISAAAQIA